MQQQQYSLQTLLAQQEQCLSQKRREVSDTATRLAELSHSQQQGKQHAQVEADLHNRWCAQSLDNLTSIEAKVNVLPGAAGWQQEAVESTF